MRRVWVRRGSVKRFKVASRRRALRIVEPVVLGSGVMVGFEAGDLVGIVVVSIVIRWYSGCEGSCLGFRFLL